MGAKEDGLFQGSMYFLCVGVIACVVLGPYVKMQTKEKSLANDNMM